MNGSDPLQDLERLVEDFRQSGLRELHARAGDLEVYFSLDANAPGLDGPRVSASVQARATGHDAVAAPAPSSTAAAGPPSVPASVSMGPPRASVPDGASLVRAPYLGTFYRAPKPGAPNYVDVGSQVSADTEMCLVEVMKLFTAVRAGAAGKVVAILAEDGELVQADQPLFAIEQG